jgi:putative glycosyltransferase (TIGR04348 family)
VPASRARTSEIASDATDSFARDQRRLRVVIVCPARAGTRHGNRVTALRWARMLRIAGCRVTVSGAFDGQPADLLIALHARKTAASVVAFRRKRPGRPVIVALTGTDLYADLARSASARRSLELADRIVVLQPLAVRELPRSMRGKVRVIHQSFAARARRPRAAKKFFDVVVIGHLRPVKDPLRAALALRRLPKGSAVRVTHLGGAMSRSFESRARKESERNHRYRWLGDRPRESALRRLARSRLLVLSSRLEGGANVISEAVRSGIPVLASRIPGSIGLLGAGYPGYFRYGDTAELARLMRRAETDRAYYRTLERWCRAVAPRFAPARELAAWRALLREIRPGTPLTAVASSREARARGPRVRAGDSSPRG